MYLTRTRTLKRTHSHTACLHLVKETAMLDPFKLFFKLVLHLSMTESSGTVRPLMQIRTETYANVFSRAQSVPAAFQDE